MTNVTYYRVSGNPTVEADAHIHKKCIHCGDEVIFLMTQEQYTRWKVNKEFVQDVFGHIDMEVREWMISGTHPSCWKEMFDSFDDENILD